MSRLNVNPSILRGLSTNDSLSRAGIPTGLADSNLTQEQKARNAARPNPNDPTKNPLSINGLIAFLSANPPASTNRFVVEFRQLSPGGGGNSIEDENAPQLSIQCESASFPGRSFETNILARYYGPYRKTPTTALYNDITMTFRCSEAHGEKKYFTNWLNQISNPNTNDYSFYSDYVREIKVHQLPRGGEAAGAAGMFTHTVTLLEAFPIRIDEIPLDYNADNAVEKLNVTFAFYKWI